MGSKRKKLKIPTPPKAPAPVAEDLSEVISPTLRQEAARRARRGAYATKGQKMGSGGQILGASPIQLANVATASGMYESAAEEKLESDAGRSFKGGTLSRLKGMGYKTTTYKRKRRRSVFGGHRTKTFEEIKYKDYLRQYNERKAQRQERAKAAQSQSGMTI